MLNKELPAVSLYLVIGTMLFLTACPDNQIGQSPNRNEPSGLTYKDSLACKVFTFDLAEPADPEGRGTGSGTTCFVSNQLVVNFTGYQPADEQALLSYLQAQGFSKIDSCACAEELELWEHSQIHPNLIGVVESAPKRGSGVGDSTTAQLSLNYSIELDSSTTLPRGQTVVQSIPRSANRIRVAVIDSGVDTLNGLLKPFLTATPDSLCNVVGDNQYGLNLMSTSDTYPHDRNGHGTHVSGIVVGAVHPTQPSNFGVFPELISVKVTEDDSASVDFFKAVCGMYYALEKKARVLNISWGYLDTVAPEIMVPLLDLAQSRDALIVAGAGNNEKVINQGDSLQFWPAAFSTSTAYAMGQSTVISVAAHNEMRNAYPSFSNRGTAVNIAAPGQGIASTMLFSTDGEMHRSRGINSGTSMAAGFVSRTAATIIGLRPDLSTEEVKNCIINQGEARPVPGGNPSLLILNHRNAVNQCEPPSPDPVGG